MRASVTSTLTMSLCVAWAIAGVATLAGSASQQDSRFSARVTTSIYGVNLKAGLDQVGEEAGLPLTCEDPGLEWRPFQAFVRNESAGEVMRQVARFFATPPGKCAWAPVAIDGESGYRLWQDERSQRAWEDRLRKAQQQRAEQLLRDIETAVGLARLTPEELEMVRDQHPALAHEMVGRRPGLRFLGSLEPEQMNQLLSGRGLDMPFAQLRPDQQSLITQLVGKRNIRSTSKLPDGTPVSFQWSSERDLLKSRVTLRVAGRLERPSLMMQIPTVPGSAIGRPNMLHVALPPENERPEWMREALAKQRQAAGTAVEEKDPPTDPALLKKVTLRRWLLVPDPKDPEKKVQRASDLSMTLKQVADQAGLSVLGDYDPCWDDYYSWNDLVLPGDRMRLSLRQDIVETPLWEALGAVADRFKITWEKQGRFLWIRSPRIVYARIDGIDLMENRLPPPPRLPDPSKPEETGTVSAVP